MRKQLFILLAFMVVVSLVAAQCGAPSTPALAPTEAPAEEAPAEEAPAEEAAPPEAAEAQRVVLIGNQRFGDQGPMDDMAAGLDQCAADYGFEIKKLESESAAEHEEDIRAMAREGYDLVMTTFPPMTEPTKGVSLEYPDTLFLGIYQFINVEGESYANIWDTEYRGQEVAYMLGSIASNLSQTKKVGYIAGAEEPSINNEINGFSAGVKAACPECSFEYAFVGSFEDPATAKEIALAMYSRGVDVIQTAAAKSQLGVIEAAKETGNLVLGDVSDNGDMYPEGYVGYMGVSFSANVIEACRLLAAGSYPAGEHGYMGLSNGGYFVPWDAIERFGQSSPDYADAAAAVLETGKDLEAKLISGEVTVEWNPETPVAYEGTGAPAAGGGEGMKIVLIGNQRFGDQGPMDDMAAGLDRCAADYGFEIKKLESESAAEHEEDIRAMAREGYNLIMTTFPPMTEPTKGVSSEFPDTLFLGIYQFINVEGENYANIWDTEYRGQEAMYVLGAMATELSQTKKVGYIAGAEEPSINNEMNGFIEGAKAACPECSFEYAFVGSFEDPAAAKEIALAMYSRGVDVIQTAAAKSQLGVIEAAKETGNLVIGDVADNVDLYPEGYVGYIGVSFSANVIEACKLLAEGNYPAGDHGYMSLANGGYYIPWDAINRLVQNNPDYVDTVTEAIKIGKDLEAKLISGEVTVEWNPETPKFE